MTMMLDALRQIVGSDYVLTDPDALQQYGKDWTKLHAPAPLAIVLPANTEEVQALVKLANTHQLAIVPSGGRTGLSGGAIAARGELVIAMDRMNQITEFNAIDRCISCQAGVITAQLQQFAEDNDLYYPVDFASSGSSQIGGNIATNAGGIKVIRYGMTRDWILGLTVVTGRGEILRLNHGLIKNNAGYDFRHLFIGSEGTLGLITEATIKLTRAPQQLTVMVLGVPDIDALMQVSTTFQRQIDLTAFELFSEQTVHYVNTDSGVPRPFAQATPYYALLEFDNTHPAIEQAAMQAFEDCMAAGWVLDGVMSQSQTQAKQLWRLREEISVTISAYTPYKNDLSVRVSRVPAYLAAINEVVKEHYPDFEVLWYGHIGDGNLHLNILKPATLAIDTFYARCSLVNKKVFELTQQFDGSISAEHGIGLLKRDYLGYTRSAEEIAYLRAMKQLFDPNQLLNPGKLLAPTENAS